MFQQEGIMATVRYLVHDVAVALTFYTTHLDFKLVDQMGPAFAIVERGDLELWLSGPQTSAARPMPDGRQPIPGGWNRFVVEIDDIDSRVASMKAAGVQFRNEIIQGPGGKQVLVDDPSGNPIELFQPAE
jgi:catechol 2,3-dioxygenase-like lactoylglutathione lyase family enzyme